MEHGILIILAIPISVFFMSLGYHIGVLFYQWLKFKLEDIKNKEYLLWD